MCSSRRSELNNTSSAFFRSSHLSSPEDNWLRFPVFFPGKTQSAVLKGHQEVAKWLVSFGMPALSPVRDTSLGHPSLHEGVMSHSDKGLFLMTWKESAILEEAIAFGALACCFLSSGRTKPHIQGIFMFLRFRFWFHRHTFLPFPSFFRSHLHRASFSKFSSHTHSEKLVQGSLALQTSSTLHGS